MNYLQTIFVFNLKRESAVCVGSHRFGGSTLNSKVFMSEKVSLRLMSLLCLRLIVRRENAYFEYIVYSTGCSYRNTKSVLAKVLYKGSSEIGVRIEKETVGKFHPQIDADSNHWCIIFISKAAISCPSLIAETV